MRRHLQDIHTGLQYQCTICTHTFQRANMRHGRHATEQDFVLFHPESGDKGPSAQKRLENFVRNVVPFAWRKVHNDASRDSTPRPNVRSTVRKVHTAVHPPNRNEKLERQRRREETKKKGRDKEEGSHQDKISLSFPSAAVHLQTERGEPREETNTS